MKKIHETRIFPRWNYISFITLMAASRPILSYEGIRIAWFAVGDSLSTDATCDFPIAILVINMCLVLCFKNYITHMYSPFSVKKRDFNNTCDHAAGFAPIFASANGLQNWFTSAGQQFIFRKEPTINFSFYSTLKHLLWKQGSGLNRWKCATGSIQM